MRYTTKAAPRQSNGRRRAPFTRIAIAQVKQRRPVAAAVLASWIVLPETPTAAAAWSRARPLSGVGTGATTGAWPSLICVAAWRYNGRIWDRLGHIVRGIVEDTRNGRLEAEAGAVVTPRPVERPPFRPGRYAPLRPDDRHHKIDHDPQVLADSLVDMFLKLNPSDLRDVAQPELKPTVESLPLA